MKAWLSIAVVALTVDSAVAQVRDRAAAPTGGASIAGTVMSDSQPSTPVRRAAVTVNSTDRRVGKTVITDDTGKYLVTGLPPGPYLIGATKRGWITTLYGAKAPGRQGRPLALADGERATVTMRMARGASITGTVLDHAGQPAPGVTLRVLRYAYTPSAGERRLVPAGSTFSGADERGVYRIWGLAPGEYYVSATNMSVIAQPRDLLLTSDVDVQEAQRALQSPGTPVADVPQRAVGLAPVFYPGTTDVAQATPVTLRAGEERSGIDMTLQYVSTSRVSGHIAGLEGSAQPVQVFLISQNTSVPEMGFEAIRMARTTPDGAFDFGGVRPGKYAVGARTTGTSPAPGGTAPVLVAIADVDVLGEDLRGLSLQLQEAFSVSGVVRFDGTATPPPLASVRVSLGPAEPSAFSVSSGSATVKPDGTFLLSGVSPGRYRLTATVPGTPAVWALRSAVAAGQDGLDGSIDIREPVAGAEITLTDRHAELTGKIQDAAGAAADYTIVLYSADRKDWRPQTRRVVTARTANDGTFAFRNVPAGEYMLAAVEDVEPGEWFDPTFLQRLLPTSMKVSIGDGEKKVQDIRVGGG